MSGLAKRAERLYKRTHTFVSAHDWRLLATQWKRRLDDANVKPDDFGPELADLKEKLGQTRDDAKIRSAFTELTEKNVLAYYAHMYKSASGFAVRYPKGIWMSNETTKFFERLREVRREEAQNG